MSRAMREDEIRAFLSHGTRTAKVAWVGSTGQAHVTPVWFLVDDAAESLEIVFSTGAESAKGRAIVRDPRISLVVDDERPPFAFVQLTGPVAVDDDLDRLLDWATRIGRRYMGPERADEFGRRNAVRGELLVRLRPTKVIAEADLAD